MLILKEIILIKRIEFPLADQNDTIICPVKSMW